LPCSHKQELALLVGKDRAGHGWQAREPFGFMKPFGQAKHAESSNVVLPEQPA
jgi:hypothetical protein